MFIVAYYNIIAILLPHNVIGYYVAKVKFVREGNNYICALFVVSPQRWADRDVVSPKRRTLQSCMSGIHSN